MPIFEVPVTQECIYHDTGFVYVQAKDRDTAMEIVIQNPSLVEEASQFYDSEYSHSVGYWEIANEDFHEAEDSLKELKEMMIPVIKEGGFV